MRILLSIIFVLSLSLSFAQDQSYSQQDLTINKHVDGTLLSPNDVKKPDLAIIIAGSGPTDRNGNQNFLKNNSLKKLSEALSNDGIATFRYDKRIVKQIKKGNVDPNIMFDHFVEDAKSVLSYFKNSNSFSKIYLVGHSQGSLVAMLASQEGADGFISLAGAGKPIDEVITDQIIASAPNLEEDTKKVFAVMKTGQIATDYPPLLASVFNESIQPFMINWMQYNPQDEIKKLNIPILIVNGTKDLQVKEAEAKLLKDAKTDAELKIIENMNHVLFIIEGDNLENSKSYNESFREITPELIESITQFIKK